MLHRIREACGRGELTLGNVVAADENHVDGKRKALKETGRGTVGKEAVMGACERGGRTIAKPVERTDTAALVPFIEGSVEQGPTVYTDDAAVYGALPNILNESVRAVLKQSITSTWHHVSPKHLGSYVNEATFRLNEGNCENHIIDRMAAFAAGLHGKRLQYVDLIADDSKSAQVLPL